MAKSRKVVQDRKHPAALEPPPFMSWLQERKTRDAAFNAEVEERLKELQSITKELVAQRKAHKLTQATVAATARVSQAFLAKLEAGKVVNPELKTLVRIGQALGLVLTMAFTSHRAGTTGRGSPP
jgi:DNA-binding XRE family transcriptional regulator